VLCKCLNTCTAIAKHIPLRTSWQTHYSLPAPFLGAIIMNTRLREQLQLATIYLNEPRTVIYKAMLSRCYNYKRRAHDYGVKSRFKPLDALMFLNASCWRCLYCNCHLSLEVDVWNNATFDHIIPLARCGKNIKSNLVPACNRCNNSRGNTALLNWLDTRSQRLDSFAIRYGLMWDVLLQFGLQR